MNCSCLACKCPPRRLFLRSQVSCELLVALRDRMGNRCTSGGAALTVNTVINVAGEEKKKLKENETTAITNVVSKCVDNKDGSYRLGWPSQGAGV